MITETELSKRIAMALDVVGIWCIRIPAAQLRLGRRAIHVAEPGTPDLCLPSLGWLEVKTVAGRVSSEQQRWHDRARRLGVRVAVVRNVRDAVRTALEWRSDGCASA